MITKRIPETEGNPLDLSAAGHRCFFCGDFVHDPAVVWNGNDEHGQQIFFHGECIFDFLSRLSRDALELRYSGRPCWNQLSGSTSEAVSGTAETEPRDH